MSRDLALHRLPMNLSVVFALILSVLRCRIGLRSGVRISW
jgi:hypothetical protein